MNKPGLTVMLCELAASNRLGDSGSVGLGKLG
jgi:hypothetical protein